MGKERTGSIVRRKDGKLFVRITYVGKDGNRHEITRRATDRKDARRIIKELLHSLQTQGEDAPKYDRLTLAEAIEAYREEKAIAPVIRNGRKIAGMRSWKTTRLYLDILDAHLGNRRMRDIRPTDLEAFKRKRLATPTKKGTERTLAAVQRELEVLRAVLRWAVRQGWLQKSPFESGEAVISKAAEARRDRVLSVEEEARLLAVCVEPRAHLRPLVIAALDTAARRGELFKLEWRDVDLTQGVITLRPEITKTGRGRQVPITPRLRAELEALKGEGKALVFGGITDIKRSFGTACRIAKIADLHFHDLRHSATTRLIAAGVNPALAMKITGHNQSATFQRYLNPQAVDLREVAERLENLNGSSLSQDEQADAPGGFVS